MDEVVRCTWVHPIRVPDFNKNPRRPHVSYEVAVLFTGTENRETIEGGSFVILRIRFVKLAHRLSVQDFAFRLVAPLRLFNRTKKQLDCPKIRFLSRCGSLGSTRFWCIAKATKHSPTCFLILYSPNRLVMGHCLAPICQSKIIINLLCTSKRRSGLFVFEAMQEKDTRYEMRLRIRRP